MFFRAFFLVVFYAFAASAQPACVGFPFSNNCTLTAPVLNEAISNADNLTHGTIGAGVLTPSLPGALSSAPIGTAPLDPADGIFMLQGGAIKQLAPSGVMQPANNLAEVVAADARTNLSAMARDASDATLSAALSNLTANNFILSPGNIAPLLGGSGTAVSVFGDWPARLMEMKLGTGASPVVGAGPVLRITLDSAQVAASCGGNADDTNCSSALVVSSQAEAASTMVTSAITAQSSSLSSASPQAINAIADAHAGSAGAEGAYIIGRKYVDTANAVGAEISSDNRTGTDCTIITNGLNPTGCVGLWITSRATGQTGLGRKIGAGIQIGLGDGTNSKFANGIVFNQAAISDTSILDASSSTTALAIEGNHNIALLISSGAGAVQLTNTTLPTQAAGRMGIAGSASIPTMDANGESDIFGTTAGGFNIIGQGSSDDFRALNKFGNTVINIPTGTKILQNQGGIGINGTTLPTPSNGWLGLSGIQSGAPANTTNGEGEVYLLTTAGLNLQGQGSNFDLMLRNKAGSAVLDIPTGTQNVNVLGAFNLGGGTLTLVTGEIGLAKIAASGSAPGAAGGKVALVCGTNAGTAKLIAYAGTSTTPVTIVDNIGTAVSGC